MTSQRLHAALLPLLLLACGGADSAARCRECPPLEGTWLLAPDASPAPTDCEALGIAPPRVLQLERRGSQLTGRLDGLEVLGTAYQGGRFSLSGNSAEEVDSVDSVSLVGLFQAAADGGSDALTGTFSGDHTRPGPTGPRRCAVSRSFTAARL
jgi:hypothetical protein